MLQVEERSGRRNRTGVGLWANLSKLSTLDLAKQPISAGVRSRKEWGNLGARPREPGANSSPGRDQSSTSPFSPHRFFENSGSGFRAENLARVKP
jgi:hypothetical protein